MSDRRMVNLVMSAGGRRTNMSDRRLDTEEGRDRRRYRKGFLTWTDLHYHCEDCGRTKRAAAEMIREARDHEDADQPLSTDAEIVNTFSICLDCGGWGTHHFDTSGEEVVLVDEESGDPDTVREDRERAERRPTYASKEEFDSIQAECKRPYGYYDLKHIRDRIADATKSMHIVAEILTGRDTHPLYEMGRRSIDPTRFYVGMVTENMLATLDGLDGFLATVEELNR